MEILELLTKAIAPQLLSRIFDNIPQFVIIFAFFMVFFVRFLLKWNKQRIEKQEKKEERSQKILEKVEGVDININILSKKIDRMETEQKETIKEMRADKKEMVDKQQDLELRITKIETKEEFHSKHDNNAILDLLKTIRNLIDKK